MFGFEEPDLAEADAVFAGTGAAHRNRPVREAVGVHYKLMFDAFMGWDATYAAEMVRKLEPIQPR